MKDSFSWEFQLLRSPQDSGYEAWEKIFLTSFPENERRPFASIHHLMLHDSRVHMECVIMRQEGTFPKCIGLLVWWDLESFVYVEYLAIDPDYRGKKIGWEVMSALLTAQHRPVVLEVELPIDDLTRRRVSFYQRLGFNLCPDAYEQPSYGVVPGLPMSIMVAHQEQLSIPIASVIEKLKMEVYGIIIRNIKQ